MYADNHESFLQIDTIILMVKIKYSQSYQDSKSTMSLQYLKKEVIDEVNFFLYESLLQCDTIIIDGHNQVFSKYNISKRKLRMEFIFCMHINIKLSTS